MEWLTILLLSVCIKSTLQHGFLSVPPQRSSLWREGFDNPINYGDNQLWCGGRDNIQKLDGLCGVCGDPHQGPHENEAGGKYANGIIGRRYEFGVPYIPISIVLSAYHKGYFEFRMCPHNKPTERVKQECLNKYLLPVSEDGIDVERAEAQYHPPGPGIYNLTLFIPPGMRCSQCVLQWRYRTGNSWGVDLDGTACVGCGVQEEFRNCADISIGGDDVIPGFVLPPPIVHEQSIIDARISPPAGKHSRNNGRSSDTNWKERHKSEKQRQTSNNINNNLMTNPKEETENRNSIGNRSSNNNIGLFHKTSHNNNGRSMNNSMSQNVNERPNKIGEVVKNNNIVKNDRKINSPSFKKSVSRGSNSYSDKQSRLRALVLAIIRRYDKLKKERKTPVVNRTQRISKVESNGKSKEMVKKLRYFVTRLQNYRLYTKLTKDPRKQPTTAIYRNRYNRINENSLEAQTYKKFWKFSPNPYFKNSRDFST